MRTYLQSIVFAASAFWACSCQEAGPPPALPTPEVTVALPQPHDMIAYEWFSGRTEPFEQVDLCARVSGYLTKIYVERGAEVKKNETLFQIDPRPYDADLARADGEFKQTDARAKRLASDLARAQTLKKSKSISQEDFDKISADYNEAAAALDATKAKVTGAKLNVDFTKISAPFAGQIGDHLVDEGNLVVGGGAGTTLLGTIVSLDPMFVAFDVDEQTLQRLQQGVREGRIKRIGNDKEIPVEMALPIHKNTYPLKGSINFINNKVDPKTGTIRVKALFANPAPKVGDRVLKPGMFVRVRVPIGAPTKALTVPESAIGTDQGNRYLYVVDDKNKAQRLEVTPGILQDGLRAIEEVRVAGEEKGRKLRPDERVIVNGLQRVRPGAVVDPKTK